jgi:hypothetical protein
VRVVRLKLGRLLRRAKAVGPARLSGAVFAGLVLVGLSGHAATRDGGGEFRPVACLFAIVLVGLGFRFRSSLATALGIVGTGMIWALSQSRESATGAVVVGALLTVVAIITSWLSEPRVATSAAGHLRRAGRLTMVLCGAAAIGLASLQFVDRPPANRVVMLMGVAAVVGILTLFFVLGEPGVAEDEEWIDHSDVERAEGYVNVRKGRSRSVLGRGAGVFPRRI